MSNSKRFKYDPRALDDRRSKCLKELNIDELREACNGCAGVLCYLPAEPNPDYQEPDLSDCSVAKEIVVTQEETTQLVTPALPPSLTDLAQTIGNVDQYCKEVSRALDPSIIQLVSEATKEQSASNSWYDYRKGRITASKLLKVAKKVREDGKVGEKNDSLLKDIMGYRPPAYSPAIHWGQYNENVAIKEFFKCKRSQHKNMKIHKCGVVLWNTNPIIAASPDALVSCSCCGVRPLEVKNPFTHRDLSISQFASQPNSCLHITSSGEIKLKTNHDYYYQVQAQILVEHAEVGYFCLKTASPYDNLHCEEIDFDPMLMAETIEKVQIFFKLVVAPELLHGKLKNKMELTGSSSDGLVPPATESDTTVHVTEEPVVSSIVDYMCLVCHKECLDEPVNFNDMSVCCDVCKQWFHWGCVGLKGTETFLKRRHLEWKCPFCVIKV